MNKKENKNLKKNRSLFNKWAKTYDLSLFQFWMRGFQKAAEKELKLQKDTKVLDLSCGTGEFLRKLQGRAKLTGIDYSEKMLITARKKLDKNTVLVKGDVHNLPFKNEEFDYVLNTEAFHHYYDQEKAILEMYRVTKKKGKIIIVDINLFLPIIHKLFENLEPGCVKVNNKKEIYILFKNIGLKNIRQERSFLFAIMTSGEK